MKRAFLVAFAMLITLTAGQGHAAASPAVPINDLIEQAKAFDGHTVTIEGEVIGDVMLRGTSGWVNVSDGTNDVGVWAPADSLRAIQLVGRYQHSGDRVRVTGEFRRADPELGGELNVRAADLVVLAQGEPTAHAIKPGRPLLAVLSVALALGLCLIRGARLRVRSPEKKGTS